MCRRSSCQSHGQNVYGNILRNVDFDYYESLMLLGKVAQRQHLLAFNLNLAGSNLGWNTIPSFNMALTTPLPPQVYTDLYRGHFLRLPFPFITRQSWHLLAYTACYLHRRLKLRIKFAPVNICTPVHAE